MKEGEQGDGCNRGVVVCSQLNLQADVVVCVGVGGLTTLSSMWRCFTASRYCTTPRPPGSSRDIHLLTACATGMCVRCGALLAAFLSVCVCVPLVCAHDALPGIAGPA